ncbi:MAG TPA: hypothetical protein VN282_00715 [Pyrinomonadaceae bacterium]|nr:hypothetical protein [Pyrinomonadaceae bacterium]
MSSRTFTPALILCLAAACALSAACGGSTPRRRAATAEAPPPAEAPAPEANVLPAAGEVAARKLPPPGVAEVRGAVERIFKGAVKIDSVPSFAVGDFNGDDSQDLAVAVSPSPGRLGEMNDELAAWIIKDPFAPPPDGSSSYGAARRRALVEEDDTLLAVIHGYGAEGWRDPQATQTFVLKDAAGQVVKARARKVALASAHESRLPRLLGDVIDETVGGRAGFIYYDGAHYAWHDPRGYRKPPPLRVVHGGMVKAAQQ